VAKVAKGWQRDALFATLIVITKAVETKPKF